MTLLRATPSCPPADWGAHVSGRLPRDPAERALSAWGHRAEPHTARTCCTCSRRAAGWPGSPRSRSAAGSSAPALCCSPAPPGPGGQIGEVRGGERTDGQTGMGSQRRLAGSTAYSLLPMGGMGAVPRGVRGGLHQAVRGAPPPSVSAKRRQVRCPRTPTQTSSSCLAVWGYKPWAPWRVGGTRPSRGS